MVDLVLVDLKLPNLNGLDDLETIEVGELEIYQDQVNHWRAPREYPQAAQDQIRRLHDVADRGLERPAYEPRRTDGSSSITSAVGR